MVLFSLYQTFIKTCIFALHQYTGGALFLKRIQMKKIIIPVLAVILLASCTKSVSDTSPADSGNSSVTTEAGVVKDGDTVSVDYVGRLEDGTVFDTSIKSEAEKAGKSQPGRTYEPLSFTVWAQQMIAGFDKGVVGMEVGEEKTLTIVPKDAYGEKTTTQSLPIQYFQDTITQKVPLDSFKDTITQDVPLKLLGDRVKELKVGGDFEADWVKAKVLKIGAENVTLEMKNTANPFFGKKLKVGLKATFEGNDITIKSIGKTEVSVEINNKKNPFYGKKLIAGLEGEIPNVGKIILKEVAAETVTVEMPNTHELAGKTLIFDVKLVSIK